MKLDRIALCLATVTLIVLMVSTASACDLPGLSPGYWKHNVKVYMGGPGHYSAPSDDLPHETKKSMEDYAAIILAAHAGDGIPPSVDTPAEFLEWANGRFQNNEFKKADPSWLTIANWFNLAAGRLLYSD
jgi:hypothetical protein